MSVDVKLPTVLRAQANGAASVAADGNTIGEVFSDLISRFPGLEANLLDGDGKLHKFVGEPAPNHSIQSRDAKNGDAREDLRSQRADGREHRNRAVDLRQHSSNALLRRQMRRE